MTEVKFEVPSKEEVSEGNQQIFEQLESKVGFVPNIYATYALSDNALGRFMQLSGGATSLSNKEKEVVFLAVSQKNGCTYCQSAHTAMAQQNGFSDDQIRELRQGKASFDPKLNALASLAAKLASNAGRNAEEQVKDFLNAGYTKENLVDTIVSVGEKTITNTLHNVTQIPNDFPPAPEL